MLNIRIPSKSLIFKSFYPDSSLDNKVKKLCIAHTSFSIMPMFNDTFFSHWNACLLDTSNNLFMLSTARKNSLTVYRISSENISQIDSKHFTFRDSDNFNYVINNNEIYDIDNKNLTVLDCIKEFNASIVSTDFNFLTTNCQYYTKEFLIKHAINFSI